MPSPLTPPDVLPSSFTTAVINTCYFPLSAFQSIDKSGARPAGTMALSSVPSDVGWIATSSVVGMVQEELLGDMRDQRHSRRGRNKNKAVKRIRCSGRSVWLKQDCWTSVAACFHCICICFPSLMAPEQQAPVDSSSKEQERNGEKLLRRHKASGNISITRLTLNRPYCGAFEL